MDSQDMEMDSYQDTLVFDVQLDKPVGARLGVDVSMVPGANGGGSLVVEKIYPVGAVQMWNSSHKPPFVIQDGDSIVRVNGVDESDVASMAAALGESGTLRVTFRRGSAKGKAPEVPEVPDQNLGKGNWNQVPEMVMGSHGDGSYIMGLNGRRLFKYEAFMIKPKGMKFGFHVMASFEPRGLSVKGIAKHGFVDLWNQTKLDIYKVRPGDCISEVNGVTCRRMIDELQNASELRLVILRPEVTNTPAVGQRPQEQLPSPQMNSFESPTGLGEGGLRGPGNLGGLEGGVGALGGVGGPGSCRGGVAGGICGSGGPGSCRGGMGGVGGVGVAGGCGGCSGCGGCGGGGCGGAGVHGGWTGSLSGQPDNMMEMGGMPQPSGGLPEGGFNNMNEEPFVFCVEMEQPAGCRFGLSVLTSAGGLIVERISPDGCVAMWNAQSRPPAQVQEGDLIIEVNGVKGDQHLTYMAMQLGGPATGGITKFVVRRDNPGRGGGPSGRGCGGVNWPSGTDQYANNSNWNSCGNVYDRPHARGAQQPVDMCGGDPKNAWVQNGPGQHLGSQQWRPSQGQNDYTMMAGGAGGGCKVGGACRTQMQPPQGPRAQQWQDNMYPDQPQRPGSVGAQNQWCAQGGQQAVPPPPPGLGKQSVHRGAQPSKGQLGGMSAQGKGMSPPMPGNLPSPFFGDYSGGAPPRGPFMREDVGDGYGVDGLEGRSDEYFQPQYSSKDVAEIAARARRLIAMRGYQTQPGGDAGDPEVLFSRFDMLSDEFSRRLLSTALKSRSPSLCNPIAEALELLPLAPVESF